MRRDKLGETPRAGRWNSKEYRKKWAPGLGLEELIAACTCLAKGHTLQRVVPGEFQQPGVTVLFAFAAQACLVSSPWVSSVPGTFMDSALGQAG